MVFSLAHEGDKPLDGYMGGTGGLTRGNGAFGDSIGTGNGLFILFENGFSGSKPLVVFAFGLNGTDFGTFPARSTF